MLALPRHQLFRLFRDWAAGRVGSGAAAGETNERVACMFRGVGEIMWKEVRNSVHRWRDIIGSAESSASDAAQHPCILQYHGLEYCSVWKQKVFIRVRSIFPGRRHLTRPPLSFLLFVFLLFE